jgi:ketosteroid isomerase-like protein
MDDASDFEIPAPAQQPQQNATQFNFSMNLKPLFAACLLCLVTCFGNPSARADDESDRAALRVIRTNYMEAVSSGDPSKIAPHLSKDVTGVMVTGEEVKGLDGLVAYWKKIQALLGPGGSYHVDVNVDQTDLFGEVAVSRGKTDDVVRLGSGKELHFNSLWTAVCHKENGAWKVVRMEAAMDPVDNVFIAVRLQSTRLVSGAVGLVAGFIVALLICLLRRRPASR